MPKTAAIFLNLSLFALLFISFDLKICAQVKVTASASGNVSEEKKKVQKTPEGKINNPVEQNLTIEILNEINLLRTNPKNYIAFLNERKDFYDDKLLSLENETSIITFEGISAVDESIKELSAAEPLKPLTFSAELSKAANDHLTDMIANSFFSHKGSDGQTPDLRVEKYLNISQSEIRENLALSKKTAREIVLTWLIDDGNARRGNRQSILSPTLNFIGIAAGKTKEDKTLIVATFSSDNCKLPTKAKNK